MEYIDTILLSIFAAMALRIMWQTKEEISCVKKGLAALAAEFHEWRTAVERRLDRGGL